MVITIVAKGVTNKSSFMGYVASGTLPRSLSY